MMTPNSYQDLRTILDRDDISYRTERQQVRLADGTDLLLDVVKLRVGDVKVVGLPDLFVAFLCDVQTGAVLEVELYDHE